MYKKIILLSVLFFNFSSIKPFCNLPDDELTASYINEIAFCKKKKSEFLKKLDDALVEQDSKKIIEYAKQASNYGLKAVYLSIKLKQHTAQ